MKRRSRSTQRALAIVEKRLSPEHPHVAEVVMRYIGLLQMINRKAEAAQLELQWLANWLGIQVKPSTEPPGFFVEQVIDGSPTAQAGIQPRDVIVNFRIHTYRETNSLNLLQIVAAGIVGPLDIEVIHDGKKRTIPVALGKRPASRP